ncbi:ABC transporter permease [Nitrospirillum sp. BR 11163]|uniref:ABC transporter permease n=1 Tax=Nitrospirillum sp. BR 11163 TaxID=3104323 RepID=UPI002B0027FD|nr:ABC transporter permease [Nitrospirillum sp. BR 11163]MEA1674489.1 ABC transporter permease [Nitrospirillum sp. BR 11163]
MALLPNLLFVAVRILLRHRVYTALNVTGLALGLAAASMIGLFVWHETHYDGFFHDAGRIYRLETTEYLPGRAPVSYPVTSLPMAAPLLRDFPEVERIVRVDYERLAVMRDGTSFAEIAAMADADYFRLFDFPFLAGQGATALDRPGTAVLTERLARKYFGTVDVVGRVLTLASGASLTVTGVMHDRPSNSHLQGDLVTRLDTRLNTGIDDKLAHRATIWDSYFVDTYLLLRRGADAAALAARYPGFLAAHFPGYREPATGKETIALSLTALGDINLEQGADGAGVQGFLGVALLVLLIAVANFVNLSTARSSLRAKEVALRKVLGAPRRTLVAQFLLESVLLALVAMVAGQVLLELAMPSLLQALAVRIDTRFLVSPWLLGANVAGAVSVGLLGGLYPALVLSRPVPATLLKGEGAVAGAGFRMGLVVFQFAASITLAIAAVVIFQQARYASTQALGFQPDGVVVVRDRFPRPGEQLPRLKAFREQVAHLKGVVTAGGAPAMPGDGADDAESFRRPDAPDDGAAILRTEPVDYEFLKALGVHLLAGRLFDGTAPADALRVDAPEDQDPAGRTIVLSLDAARRLGFAAAEEAVGQTVIFGKNYPMTIVGVVDPVRYTDARMATQPVVYVLDPASIRSLAIRLTDDAGADTLAAIDALWRGMYPDAPMIRRFLTDSLADQSQQERRQALLLGVFTGLALVIACLGLFGLAAFTAERRTKEMGLRKVMGAGILDIVHLMVWQFSKPVLLAEMIAWPLAWLGLRHWLAGFTLRTPLDPLVFVAAGAVALAIAWITVAGHAARVASAKPVKALRYE